MLSIIMATYNNEDTISAAVRSTLIEPCVKSLIVVNDGSFDKTAGILRGLQHQFPNRLAVYTNEENQGLAYSLNKAIRYSDTPFIGRMDADDLSCEGRLQKQLTYLLQNPHCHILGTFAETFKNGKRICLVKPVKHAILKKNITWDCPLIHPSVMLRAEVFERILYDETLKRAQDWDLWSKCIREFHIENLPVVGIKYKLTRRKSVTASLSRYKVACRIEKIFGWTVKSKCLNIFILMKSLFSMVKSR